MVLPERIVRAAARASGVLGDWDHVAAWLGAGRGVDEVDDRYELTMLLLATYGPSSHAEAGASGRFDEDHVALARLLVDHGADVNRSSRKVPRTVNGTGHTGPSEFCATSI